MLNEGERILLKRLIPVVSVLIILVVVYVYTFQLSQFAKTPEEALIKNGMNISRIVYEEKVKDGVVVFLIKSINNDSDYISSAQYVKQNLFGWKRIWGGEHSGNITQSFTSQYFDYVKDTPFPMIFGEVKDPKIGHIMIKDIDNNKEKEAQIVGNVSNRMWFVSLDMNDGPRFKISALSNANEVLESEDIRTDLNQYTVKR